MVVQWWHGVGSGGGVVVAGGEDTSWLNYQKLN